MRSLRVLPIALALAGCVSTQELPLAPNVVRLDTHASGALFAGQATGQTMKRAAEITLQNRYSHFRLEEAQLSHGSQFAGMSSYGTGTAIATGYGYGAFGTGTYTGFSTPIYRPTTDVGVTVVMFHANDPGAKDAFDAAAVLKKYGG
jgi:hypothetical protein